MFCLLLQDSPRDTVIYPRDDVMHVGQELHCFTSASPDAHAYEWFTDSRDTVGVGQTLALPSEWMGADVALSCRATNTIGSDSVGVTFRVACVSRPSNVARK